MLKKAINEQAANPRGCTLFSYHMHIYWVRKAEFSISDFELRRNARDIVDQWIVFSFHLDICQQCPDRHLLFTLWKEMILS